MPSLVFDTAKAVSSQLRLYMIQRSQLLVSLFSLMDLHFFTTIRHLRLYLIQRRRLFMIDHFQYITCMRFRTPTLNATVMNYTGEAH